MFGTCFRASENIRDVQAVKISNFSKLPHIGGFEANYSLFTTISTPFWKVHTSTPGLVARKNAFRIAVSSPLNLESAKVIRLTYYSPGAIAEGLTREGLSKSTVEPGSDWLSV